MKRTLSIILCVIMVTLTLLTATGCTQKYDGEINVYNWGEYIAIGEDGMMDVISEFEKKYNIKVNYTNYETNEEMYNILSSSNSSYDVIIPSDYMIGKLISENMLLELDFDNIPNYKNIMDEYKNLSYDPENKYSVPYSWGTVGIVYNKNMVDGKVTSWKSLWDQKNKGQILMINNSRDAMAIAMSVQGIDPEDITKENIDKASKKLLEQKPILKKYVMDQVFSEMENDQSAIAPYYAGDILTMMQVNENLDYCLPEEGTNLFVDAMCIPKSCKNKEGAEKFINFMLEPEVGKDNTTVIGYSTPNKETYKLLDDDIKNNELIYPSKEYLAKCYTFSNIPDDIYNYMQEEYIKAISD